MEFYWVCCGVFDVFNVFWHVPRYYDLFIRCSGECGSAENLGAMYAAGKGGIQDNVYAHMWFNIGASNGDVHAVKYRDIITNGRGTETRASVCVEEVQGLLRSVRMRVGLSAGRHEAFDLGNWKLRFLSGQT